MKKKLSTKRTYIYAKSIKIRTRFTDIIMGYNVYLVSKLILFCIAVFGGNLELLHAIKVVKSVHFGPLTKTSFNGPKK